MSTTVFRCLALSFLLVLSRAALAEPVRIALFGEQTTHSLHRENDPEYPRFLGEMLDSDFAIDATKPHPTGGGMLCGAGSRFVIGNFAHPQGTILDHAQQNPKAILRSEELKLAEAFAPQIVVLGPFGDHESLSKVSFDQLATNLSQLIDRISNFSSHPRIVLALPLPRGPKDEDANYRRIKTETEQVARERNLAIVDLWNPFLGHPEFFQDATHLTIPGRKQLAALVAQSLEIHGLIPGSANPTARR